MPGGPHPWWLLIVISATATVLVAVPVGFLTPVGARLNNAIFGGGPNSAGTAVATPSGTTSDAVGTTGPGNLSLAAQTGPGCPDTPGASTSPYNSSVTHQWLRGGTPGCLTTYLYTLPTTAVDPTQWQNDLDWWFTGVPTTRPCTIGIYIPAVSYAAGTALYYWTTGSPGYSPSTAFNVDQATSRGRWVTIGPFRFPTGRAHLEITDTRVSGADATLVASAVRLSC